MRMIVQNPPWRSCRSSGGILGVGEVGHSQADKAKTHQRILDAAALQLKETGLAGVSIGGVPQPNIGSVIAGEFIKQ